MFEYNKDNVHSKQRHETEIKRIIHNKMKQLNWCRSNEKAKMTDKKKYCQKKES